MNCSEALISQSDYGRNILKTIVRLQGQSKALNYSTTSYLVSIYDKMTHNVVYLFSTPNLGNCQADRHDNFTFSS